MDLYDLQALMGDSVEAEDYRDLWVVDLATETRDAGSLLGEARRMADSLGAYVHYVGAGDSAAAIAFGADRVHPLAVNSADAAVAALASFFESRKPEFVFFTADELANEVAARLAQRLCGGAITNCIALRLDEAAREIIASHPVYDGAYYLDSAVTTKPQVFTVRPGVFPAPLRDAGRSGETEPLDTPETASLVRDVGAIHVRAIHVRAIHESPLRPTPLRKAAKVLAVGRAGNDDESIATAKQVAEKIGAHFAGDRSAFDSGWIGEDQIVGVIGTEIAPDIYIAAGIWGDTLHRAGVEGAKTVIAIHSDKTAPIFSYADACIVGKPKDVLPKLLALLDNG
ncbi:MAG: electron transfer flavoprotein subunit alpha/FixB family protein [Chloroflexota bacterium]